EILNKKAYFIARKALWFTPKADAAEIRSRLNRSVSINRTTASGRMELSTGPYGPIIINARRGRAGQPGLHGVAVRGAVRDARASRLKSIAFLKAGWIPAIRIFDSLVSNKAGAAPIGSDSIFHTLRVTAQGRPAEEGDQPIAQIEN